MNVNIISAHDLKELLGATHDINTDEFWDNESDDVFYCDCDKDTCINAFLDVFTYSELVKMCTLYYVPRDYMYYLVKD
ncbi:hypothetical protein [Levilactobacillus phage ENFP1]|nr:hypothetical protein [Levilactobacillus phage ENFP1]